MVGGYSAGIPSCLKMEISYGSIEFLNKPKTKLTFVNLENERS